MRKPPKWQYPKSAERQYSAELHRLVADIKAQAVELLYPALSQMMNDAQRTDAWPETLLGIMEKLVIFGRSRAAQVAMTLGQQSERVNTFNRNQWNKIAEATIGVNAIKSTNKTDEAIRAWSFENSLLIKTIPEQLLSQVATVTANGMRQGLSIRDLQKEITQRFNVADSRAEVIARTEVGKLNSQLTKTRMEAAGVTKYRWQASMDERTRPEHAARNGRIYEWSKPPSGGHPGEDFQCRCVAIPVFDDFE